MTPAPGQSLSVWWVAAGASLLVLVFGAGVLVASYNQAHRPPNSESWDGPVNGDIGTCAGPFEDWMNKVNENRARVRERNARAAARQKGFVAHFVTEVVPWHFQRRPLLPLLIVGCEIGVLIAAYRLRVMEKTDNRTGPARVP